MLINRQAYNFKGTGSITFSPYSVAYGERFTIELWIKPSTNTQADFSSFIMRGNAGTANGLHIYGNKICFRSGEPNGQGVILEDFNSANYPIGEWTHVALTVNGKDLKFYRNFNLVATAVAYGSSTSTVNTLSIGDWSANFGAQFKGSIALVRVWKDILDISEINKNSRKVIKADLRLGYQLKPESTLETVIGVVGYDYIPLFSDDKLAIKNPTTNEHYSLSDNTLIHLPDNSTKNMILHGIEQGKEIQLDVPFDKNLYPNDSPVATTKGKVFTQDIGKINTLNIKEPFVDFERLYTWYETNMTSDTSPSPLVASASSVYNTNYPAWKAFNGTNINDSDGWLTANGAKAGWIQLDFGREVSFNMVALVSSPVTNASVASPKDFNIDGSNDRVNYDTVRSITGEGNWKPDEMRQYLINPLKKYRYWRIDIKENNGHIFSKIGEIRFCNKREVN
ncbi:LamG-like jellyroll fold domain-containing protein [Lysinibacillus parviboronicapiens]|uniref:LamG-like jellyroll fold domain-containing protein n=1 Tax=Lysinibacillus parviboronicapiens TaxID=436516 RepID=UPI000D3C1842|nr:LamG-like jellyroll fold domain-containing protein [Lysinibacillus parviboronicapiens]